MKVNIFWYDQGNDKDNSIKDHTWYSKKPVRNASLKAIFS